MMIVTRRTCLFAIASHLAAWNSVASANDRPISGKKVPGFEPIDAAILEFMDTIGCHAATIAISGNGEQLYSRGYGWSDEAKRKPVLPDALMRIASVTKPITAAAVKDAIRAKLLTADTKAFELIAVKAPGDKIADQRIQQITVRHLLEHKGGWDRDATFDPMFRLKQIEKKLELTTPATPANVIQYMLTQPLQFAPGEKTAYSNFGYCVLGRVLETVMKKPYADCIQEAIGKPLGIKDLQLGFSAAKQRPAREVWYPVAENAFALEVLDAHGGLIASAPALCQFLEAYWISGERRARGQRGSGAFFGSLPGTTAMVYQRTDGINVAVLLNGRRDKHINTDNENLHKAIAKALDTVRKK